MKTLLWILLTVLAVLATPLYTHAQTCRTSYPVEVCQTTVGSSVQITVQALEDQNESLPITGFWVEGRILLQDGTFYAFKHALDRYDWMGQNQLIVAIPSGFAAPVVADKLSVIVRRDDRAVRFW